ncbi:uncharacterized protein LAJ45_10509 [Morchella importuna]|uniref:uncharacterized protein n=1 Tax=Morchella importuna TaxID=1174673 RepID=UPI001E8CF005|nr:uncharacterized protein LAJ45_10509 [Morchella importuna]KAH8145539.1 hypothetical protein LAJ45_10509 [Morchella importuna]
MKYVAARTACLSVIKVITEPLIFIKQVTYLISSPDRICDAMATLILDGRILCRVTLHIIKGIAMIEPLY